MIIKYVSKLTEAELKTLEEAHNNHQTSRVRNRAHVIILSNKGYQMQAIGDICGLTRQAVSRTIDNWEASGITGLFDACRPGRTPLLTPEDEEYIHEIVKKEPRSTKKIIIALGDRRGKKVSGPTIRRVINKKRTWKRIRKSLKGKRDEQEFREKQEEIRAPEERREKGEIDVRYSDGAGFNETPCVPYAYQPKSEYIEVTPAKGQTLNVIGFMNKDNDCTPYVFECTINTDVVIACFENFVGKINQETHVVMDNAPVHRSYKFLSCLPEWEERGLHVVFLSAYSPELNLIEILWRKIKYEWLPFAAYASFKALTECIEDILLNFGSQYIIEFN